jgi:hypothetical protein
MSGELMARSYRASKLTGSREIMGSVIATWLVSSNDSSGNPERHENRRFTARKAVLDASNSKKPKATRSCA